MQGESILSAPAKGCLRFVATVHVIVFLLLPTISFLPSGFRHTVDWTILHLKRTDMQKNLIQMTALLFGAICVQLSPTSCKKNDSLEMGKSMGKSAYVADALPHTKQYAADVANAWFTTLTEVVKAKPYFSPQAIRIFAYSGLALYESVLPGMPSRQSLLERYTGSFIEIDKKKDYYWPACANAAIHRISSRIMQTYATPNLTLVNKVEDSIRQGFPAQLSPEQLQESIDFGTKVADLIFEWSLKDGTYNPDGTFAQCPPYVPNGVPGSWQPTPPAFLPAAGACQGKLRTFTWGTGTPVISEPPPSYSTDPASAFYLAADEVYQNNIALTDDERKQFENWRDINTYYIPVSHIIRIAANIFKKEKVDLETASVLYLKMTFASHDAIVSVFNEKFKYALIRPVTYIRSVLGKSTWLSLPITPQTPSYPDEMAATAASVSILESHFGHQYAFTDSTHKQILGEWKYKSFSAMLTDIEEARVSGGTTFRFCAKAGIKHGRTVGEVVGLISY
jgi:hypothetical protein